jgi:dihydroorotate dehydrogenase electron transfer subunit
VEKSEGYIVILFKISGSGTTQLSCKDTGEKIHILGPLGNGFPKLNGECDTIMAAGGIGLPPLFFLAKKSIADGLIPRKITFIAGAKNKTELFAEKSVLELGINLTICTDDGSVGRKGHVVTILTDDMAESDKPLVYACGPSAMLFEIDKLLVKRSLVGYLSLESLMPCGYGICSGCAVKVVPSPDRGPTDDNRDYHLKRVCIDGPVFKSGEVIWA